MAHSDDARVEERAITAFREVAAAIANDSELDDVLRLIVRNLSSLIDVNRCSVHLLDEETGLLQGRVVYPVTEGDLQVRRLVSGMAEDQFTREILQTRRPVALSNSLSDPRAVQSVMRKWNTRSVLGVPMVIGEEVVGVLYLDSEQTERDFTASEQEMAVAFAEMAATAIFQLQLTNRLRSSLSTVDMQVKQLQRAAEMEDQLTELILSGSGLSATCRAVTRLLNKPFAIYDVNFRRIVGSEPPTPARRPNASNTPELAAVISPEILNLLDELDHGRPRVLGPVPWLGLPHRILISEVAVNDECWGYVVVVENPSPFSGLDKAIVRRAALNIALERSGAERGSHIEWHTAEALASSMIRGERTAIEDRAEAIGVRLDAQRVVCLLSTAHNTKPLSITPKVVSSAMTGPDSPSMVLATPSESEIAFIMEIPEQIDAETSTMWVKAQITDGLGRLGVDEDVYIAISSVISESGDDFAAHTEARQVLVCMRNHLQLEGHQLLAAEELGAGRLILSSADSATLTRFVDQSLGPLVDRPQGHGSELLQTLNVFVQAGRGVRRSAQLLGVHPNTVRYRLSSIEKMTGLAITASDDAYLTAQLALLVLRLNGHLPLTPLATLAADTPSPVDR